MRECQAEMFLHCQGDNTHKEEMPCLERGILVSHTSVSRLFEKCMQNLTQQQEKSAQRTSGTILLKGYFKNAASGIQYYYQGVKISLQRDPHIEDSHRNRNKSRRGCGEEPCAVLENSRQCPQELRSGTTTQSNTHRDESGVLKNSSSFIFSAALFTKSKMWYQPKYSPRDESIKMCCTQKQNPILS